jgi:hypothetical protein
VIDQSNVDLLRLIGGEMKKVAGTNGGEWAGPCPFCGGRDRFRVWPEQGRWWCRKCERHGDAVSFVQQREHVSFREALRMLHLEGQARAYQPTPAAARPPEPTEPPPEAWQAAARAFVEESITHLRGDYQKPLDWLHRRGYQDATIQYGQIGYHPGVGTQGDQCFVSRSAWGLPDEGRKLWLPRGIVIPWFVDGVLWKLFIRRPIPRNAWEVVRRPRQDAPVPRGIPTTVLRCLREQRSYLTVEALARRCDLAVGDVQAALAELDAAKLVQRPTKHYQVPGGSKCIYNADAIQPDKPVMLVEAALDALAVQQEAGDLCTAVATGTTGGRSVRWAARLTRASTVLLAYDNDQGGNTPTAYWQNILREQGHVWRPCIDDPAAMLEQGMNLRGWVAAGLLAAAPPNLAALEEQLFTAAVARDWLLAYALADHHTDPYGARIFLGRMQEDSDSRQHSSNRT